MAIDVGAAAAGELLVLGGRQRSPAGVRELGDSWYGYDRGVVLGVGPAGVRERLVYESPATVRGSQDPVLFKQATRDGERLLACTQTEVLELRLPELSISRHLSLPCFNDVHHVRPWGADRLLVASSGTETVLLTDFDGVVHDAWHTLGGDPWPTIRDGIDYRVGVDLKPHASHPNHVFELTGAPWVTRFEQRDAVCLTDRTRRIDIATERVHDGDVHGGFVHFTTVDGSVVIADVTTLEIVRRVRLEGAGPDEALGWCRGLLLTDDHVWVGFSRIRFTRFRQRVSWLRTRTTSRPTRIARYRLPDWRLEDEVDLEPHGLNAVFSIIGPS